MNHRHLLPNEIDLLVDGEAGFGVAPLRAHVLECDDCRERLAEARLVVDALESLPHFAPDARLRERVMAEVPVFVPAHVAARDSVTRWLPRSGTARMLAAGFATIIAGALTGALVWLATRGEAALFVGGMIGDRVRATVLTAARELAVTLLGESTLSMLKSAGPLGASLLAFGFLVAAVGTVAGLRRLATVSSRRA